jgi:hypothetical protein
MRQGDPNPLEKLVDLLRKDRLHFGYRVANGMARFLWFSRERIDPFGLNTAIDIQIRLSPIWSLLAACHLL